MAFAADIKDSGAKALTLVLVVLFSLCSHQSLAKVDNVTGADNSVTISNIVMSGNSIPFILDNKGDVWAFKRPFSLDDPINLNLHHIKKLLPFMALSDDGHVYTWELSKKSKWPEPDDLDAIYTAPQLVKSLEHVTDIASAGNYFAAAEDRQRVYEWGQSFYKKQLNILAPKLVYTHEGIQAIATSGHSTIVLINDKTIVGWGMNAQTQLGIDPRVDIPPDQPTSIQLPEASSYIFMSDYHAIVLTNSGKVLFWGNCLQKDYNQQTKEGIQATQGAIVDVSAVSVQTFDDNIFPDVYLKRDGTIWVSLAPLPPNTEQCQNDLNTSHYKHDWSLTRSLGGISVPAIAIANGGDGSATDFTTLALGKDNTLWGANFRYPERGFRKLTVNLSN